MYCFYCVVLVEICTAIEWRCIIINLYTIPIPVSMETNYQLEACNAGGWKARFDPENYSEIAERIRESVDLDVDTDHMLLWHQDGVKLSFVKSSGALMVRTEDKEQAETLVETALSK